MHFSTGMLIGMAAGLVTVSAASADVQLATIVFEGSGQVSSTPSWTPYLSYGNPAQPNPAAYMNGVTLSLLDVLQGNSFELTGDFAAFEALARSDADDPIYIGFTVPGGTGAGSAHTELSLLAGASGLAPGVGAPDFADYDLTRVRVMGTAFQSGANGAFTTTVEFTVYGDRIVPEPTTATALALCSAFARRRRR